MIKSILNGIILGAVFITLTFCGGYFMGVGIYKGMKKSIVAISIHTEMEQTK